MHKSISRVALIACADAHKIHAALSARIGCRLGLLCTLLLAGQVSALESGARIPVGGEGRGPLAAHAVVAHPIGAIKAKAGKGCDIFVSTGRFGSDTGLFLYPFKTRTAAGTPVFGARMPVTYPLAQKSRDKAYPRTGTIFESADGVVYGVWLDRKNLVCSIFDRAALAFKSTGKIVLKGLPRNPACLALIPNTDSAFEVLLGVSDDSPGKPTDFGSRDPAYRPYDGAGVWRGGFPYMGLYAAHLDALPQESPASAQLASLSLREVRGSCKLLTIADFGQGPAVLSGSHYGGLYYFPRKAGAPLQFSRRVHLVDPMGIAQRHPTVGAAPLAYPNSSGKKTDLIVGGEGGLYFYAFSGEFSPAGKPIYAPPVYALEEPADLYAGTLPVPNAVDWDGDGDIDLVAGNSEGRVLFFENTGGNQAPAFQPGTPIQADGHPIHIQPGYRDDIQGPGEARWGYTCPAVLDWNGDGLLDILMSDSTAKHRVYINRGAPEAPRLDRSRPLYFDDLDFHGTWRVKPAAARIGDRMAYVALDDDDEFHLYWRVDDYNIEEGGKLTLDTGAVIGANFLSAGGTGRLKLNLVDWDADGRLDLLVGTPRHGSVPDPEKGLPQSLGLPGSAVLLLRNVGEAATPRFAFPKLVAFQGAPIFLGQHACGPTLADFGNPAGPDLIVGEEDGRFLFYAREALSLDAPKCGVAR